MKISVVVPAYNEEKYIGMTLSSIKALSVKEDWTVEILVINGGSTDNTKEVAIKYGAKVIDEPHKGIGFARQEGIKHATGKIIAFTDADTVVPKDWLLRHVTELSQPNVAFTYGTFRVTDGKFPYYHFINFIQPHYLWLIHHLFGKPIAAGQNLAFWREKALRVGGFDDKILLFEDVDFAIRMKKTGDVKFIPDLVVISSGRRSNEGWSFFIRMSIVSFKYFVLGRRSLGGFPDFR
jgi:glycosyltransferase involved in cell wall biosynthesis